MASGSGTTRIRRVSTSAPAVSSCRPAARCVREEVLPYLQVCTTPGEVGLELQATISRLAANPDTIVVTVWYFRYRAPGQYKGEFVQRSGRISALSHGARSLREEEPAPLPDWATFGFQPFSPLCDGSRNVRSVFFGSASSRSRWRRIPVSVAVRDPRGGSRCAVTTASRAGRASCC